MKYKNLNGWVWVYNGYTETWMAAKREHYKDLFSNYNSPHILKAREYDVLLDIIERTNGDKEKIDKLINNE